MATIEMVISGKVQGVFFRAATKEQADLLGLTGWVTNLPDGSVQVRATGPDASLKALETWCATGPSRARVSSVVVKPVADESFDSFRVLR